MKRNEENKLPETEEVIATACAIENIYLTLTAYGLGGYLSTGGITYFEEAKTFFGLGAGDKLIGFFYIGYPENGQMPASGRTPVGQKVRWIDRG
jgi:nitroreductase